MQYLHKSTGDEVDFLPAYKHKIFLQDDSITLVAHNRTCPKYQKQPVYNIFAISQGKHATLFLCNIKEMSDAVDFLHSEKHESLLQFDTKIFWEV